MHVCFSGLIPISYKMTAKSKFRCWIAQSKALRPDSSIALASAPLLANKMAISWPFTKPGALADVKSVSRPSLTQIAPLDSKRCLTCFTFLEFTALVSADSHFPKSLRFILRSKNCPSIFLPIVKAVQVFELCTLPKLRAKFSISLPLILRVQNLFFRNLLLTTEGKLQAHARLSKAE